MTSKKFILKKSGQALLHLIFWCGVLLFYTYFFGVNTDNINYVLSFSLFLMPITIATTYVSVYKLIPDYLLTKRYAQFALYSAYTIIISAYLIVISIFFGLIYLSNFRYTDMAPISRNLLLVMIAVYVVVVVVSAFKLLKLNVKHVERTSKLENKILETQLKLKEQELNYLKMQIHPHFLFNTLNTMYGFALKKADETPEIILKLSNLLDYLLYQINKPSVQLIDEINHIKDYIDLEQIRFHDTLKCTFKTELDNETLEIAPMLFIPFVENSFKHGVIKNGFLNLDISITNTDKTIRFNIKNTNAKQDSVIHGIGLENIKKRLELLYKGQYLLEIKNSDENFEVNLTINTDIK